MMICNFREIKEEKNESQLLISALIKLKIDSKNIKFFKNKLCSFKISEQCVFTSLHVTIKNQRQAQQR
jgi:hypothetical protein